MSSPHSRFRRCVTLTAAVLATVPALPAQDPAAVDYRALVDKAVELFAPTGLAVAVVENGDVVLETGRGRLAADSDAPVTALSVFNIASCTKAFTASTVGLCVQRGLCAWDDPVVQHLPEFRMADPWITGHMTVRDLLCHRSGLVTFAGDLLWYGSDRSDEEVLAGIEKLPISKRFREQFGYQNLLYLTAGLLVERLTGQDWEDFVRQEFLQPLGMSGTGTSHGELPADAVVALPHIGGERTRLVTLQACRPAASLWSSVHDLTAWLRFNLATGKVGDRQLMQPAVFTELWKPHTSLGRGVRSPADTANLASYGLGWFLSVEDGKKVVEHGGGMPGYLSTVTMVPADDFGFVILNNGMHGVLNEALRRALLAAHAGRDGGGILEQLAAVAKRVEQRQQAQVAAREAQRREGTAPHRALADYTGRFRDELLGDAVVELRSAGLHLQVVRSAETLVGTLSHWHDDTFRVDFPDRFLPFALIRFELGFGGAVTGFTVQCPIADFDFDSLDFRRVDE